MTSPAKEAPAHRKLRLEPPVSLCCIPVSFSLNTQQMLHAPVFPFFSTLLHFPIPQTHFSKWISWILSAPLGKPVFEQPCKRRNAA